MQSTQPDRRAELRFLVRGEDVLHVEEEEDIHPGVSA